MQQILKIKFIIKVWKDQQIQIVNIDVKLNKKKCIFKMSFTMNATSL